MFYETFRLLVREAGFPVFDWGDPLFYFSAPVIQQLREVEYAEKWRLTVQNNWYHLRLEDQSLFVFSTFGGNPSYSFIDRPIDIPSIREFVASRGLKYGKSSVNETLADYQEVLATASLRTHVTPIRYDLDPRGYEPGIHPVAHIHIGLDNQIRLALRRELTPTAFLLFVMRQMYPVCWSRLLSKRDHLRLRRRVRDDLIQLEDEHFGELDHDSIYFI